MSQFKDSYSGAGTITHGVGENHRFMNTEYNNNSLENTGTRATHPLHPAAVAYDSVSNGSLSAPQNKLHGASKGSKTTKRNFNRSSPMRKRGTQVSLQSASARPYGLISKVN